VKAVTGNRLADGRVVYVDAKGALVEALERAQVFANEDDARAALARAEARVTELAAAYLIEVAAARPAGRERLRESIRQGGPTIFATNFGNAA